MKKLVLIVISLYFTFSVSAQKTHITDRSNIWKEMLLTYNMPDPPIFTYTTYGYLGDTTIGLFHYYRFSFEANLICLGCGCLMREDTLLNKVYVRDEQGDSDILLMDYNLQAGDTFNAPYHQFKVIRFDSTLINATWHKVWYFPPVGGGVWGSDTVCFIEGIGCVQHPTFMLEDLRMCVECMEPYMYCFSNNGLTPALSPPVIFLNNTTSCVEFPKLLVDGISLIDNSVKIFPNPASTELTISTPNKITSISITNSIGQVFYSSYCNLDKVQVDVTTFPSGIYLVTVNKTMVRKFVKEL